MPTHVVYGCFYPNPEQNSISTPNALPANSDNLRRWQMPDICRRVIGKPIRLHHRTTGALVDPFTMKKTLKSTSIVSGIIPLGHVVDAWIDPDTHSAHWIGEVTYDTDLDEFLADSVKSIDRATLWYGWCSLTHSIATQYAHANPIDISIATKSLRRGARVYWDGNFLPYLRKTGWHSQHTAPVVMASASVTTPEIAPGATADALAAAAAAAAAAPMATDSTAANHLGGLQPEDIKRLLAEHADAIKQRDTLLAAHKDQATRKNAEILTMMDSILREAAGVQQTPEEEAGTTVKYATNPALVAASAAIDSHTTAVWDALKDFAIKIHNANSGGDGIVTAGASTKRTKQQPPEYTIPHQARNVSATPSPPVRDLVAEVRARLAATSRAASAGNAAYSAALAAATPTHTQPPVVRASAAAPQAPYEDPTHRLMQQLHSANAALTGGGCVGRRDDVNASMFIK